MPAAAKGTAESDGSTLMERIIDHLAQTECAKSTDIAEVLGVPMIDVRNELLEMEKFGLVYRTGQTRGTRWWLG